MFIIFILWPPHVKSWLIGKDSDAGRDWGQEEKGTTGDEMAGWHHWLDGRWLWVNSRSWWWTGRPGMLWFMGSQRVGHDWATELNWIIIYVIAYIYCFRELFLVYACQFMSMHSNHPQIWQFNTHLPFTIFLVQKSRYSLTGFSGSRSLPRLELRCQAGLWYSFISEKWSSF